MILQFLNKFFSFGKGEKHSDVFVSKEEISNNTLAENIPSGRFEVKCTDEFIAKNYTGDSITQKDVSDDKLLSDISYLMTECKNTATVNFTKVNTVEAFGCIRDRLEGLKANYTYLN